MWHANHDARTAGLGHRRSTQRHAADAAQAVEKAEAAIAAIHAEGAPHKQHLDQLQIRDGELRALTERTRPARPRTDRQQIAELDQILDATDTYTAWLDGRPTPTARLAHAVDTLTTVARHAPSFATDADPVDKTQWYQLLDLAPDDLHRRLSQAAARSTRSSSGADALTIRRPPVRCDRRQPGRRPGARGRRPA